MSSVDLTEQEWQQVISLLANNCVWAQVNPLLVRISQQLDSARKPNGPMGVFNARDASPPPS